MNPLYSLATAYHAPADQRRVQFRLRPQWSHRSQHNKQQETVPVEVLQGEDTSGPEGLDRLDVTFSSSVSAEKETDRPVARLIHLIWLGSPLASKFLPGIRSFVTLNPGEWADTVGPELK